MNLYRNSVTTELIFMLETPTHWRMSPDNFSFAETFDLRLCCCPDLNLHLTELEKTELYRLISLLNEGSIEASTIVSWFKTLKGNDAN